MESLNSFIREEEFSCILLVSLSTHAKCFNSRISRKLRNRGKSVNLLTRLIKEHIKLSMLACFLFIFS